MTPLSIATKGLLDQGSTPTLMIASEGLLGEAAGGGGGDGARPIVGFHVNVATMMNRG